MFIHATVSNITVGLVQLFMNTLARVHAMYRPRGTLVSHRLCEILLWETVEHLLVQTALNQQRACVNSVGPPYRKLDQEASQLPWTQPLTIE